jgi:hypothetical protein
MRVIVVSLHYYFSSREEFQITCPYLRTGVSLGNQKDFMVVILSRRRCKLHWCPPVSS